MIKVLVFVAVCGFTLGMFASQADAVDPRIRTYVYPKRILWFTSAERHDDGWQERRRTENLDLLLKDKFGQVCEGRFASSTGTKLINNGEMPGFILDFGRELHGGVQLGMSPKATSGARLRLRFGESVSETMSSPGDGRHATNDHALRDFELAVPSFGSIEVGHTGFRFLRVDLITGGEVGFEFIRAVSLMRPMKPIGFFRSSDERLNRIFETAVRTVHLCCQEYLWDGIKRDRLVWMGDLHPEAMTIMNVFGAEEIIPRSLDYMAATATPEKWMHGMPTYTLWWIRNLADWYRYTGDVEYVKKHIGYLEKTFDKVCGAIRDGEWVEDGFLDWPTWHDKSASKAGAQGLAYLALIDVEMLAKALGNESMAHRAKQCSRDFKNHRPDPRQEKSAAAMLALAGLREPEEMYSQVLGVDGYKKVSTFYGYYMLEAMSAAGKNQRALNTVRDYWGGMLDMGATSFWEDFDLAWTNNAFRIDELPVAGKRDIHGDFGQFCYPGFRHSLCHGWSCGPAAWCINNILGIRPISTGCKEVEIKPFLGDLQWVEGAMALPDGRRIHVRCEKRSNGSVETKVNAPSDVSIVRR
jgi:hypothetical protein